MKVIGYIMERKQITVDNKVYEALAIFHNDETNKDYVVFTDLKNDKSKGITLSCAICKEENEEIIPIKIEETRDKEIAVNLIKTVMAELNKLSKRN